MSVIRSALLAASQNNWLREKAARFWFVRRAVSRFMPGETLEDALASALGIEKQGLGTVFTYLGENVSDPREATAVKDHYLTVLEQVRNSGLKTEISVKLTHLGLDLSTELCASNLTRLIEAAGRDSVVWVDMESSEYVDRTLEIFRCARKEHPNVGLCLQAYLYRTAEDLASLIPLGAAVRLVKGAYREPPEIAFPRKRDVDENYFQLTRQLLSGEARKAGVRPAIATHDPKLIRRIQDYALAQGLGKDCLEFQMLYGIQTALQHRLAREGWRSIILIAYGSCWFPWFMRRLAERPANVLFVIRNLVPA
jgi:proline dehydrogenase